MKKPRNQHKPKQKKKAAPQAAVKRATPAPAKMLEFPPLPGGARRVLHVGCGSQEKGYGLHPMFRKPGWVEVRLDIDPTVKPDVLSDMRAMPMIPDKSMDAVWSSHNIEHIWAHEVAGTLAEFHRVLKEGGLLMLATPDVEKVAEDIPRKGLEGTLYTSPSGPITPLDILYGFGGSLKQGHHFMAHKTGFSAGLLARRLAGAGFLDVKVQRQGYNLLAAAYRRAQKTPENQKPEIIQEDINAMMQKRDELDKPPSREYKFTFRK